MMCSVYDRIGSIDMMIMVGVSACTRLSLLNGTESMYEKVIDMDGITASWFPCVEFMSHNRSLDFVDTSPRRTIFII